MDACTSRYQYSALTTKTREKPITKLLEVFVTVCASLDYPQYCLRRVCPMAGNFFHTFTSDIFIFIRQKW